MKRIIEAALQDRPCDLVLKNARIVNVFTDQILEGDIGICGGRIAGIGSMEGKEETDLQGRFVLPGFIDAHLHIESSMVTPQALSPVLLSHGVTTAVCDPHEIANACGLPGIRFMLDNAGLSRMDYRFTLPSSVPSCDFEINGAGTLSARDMEPLLAHPRVAGLAEVMRIPDVLSARPEMMEKLAVFQSAGLVIDGHAPALSGHHLQAYKAAGIENDHEAMTAEEAIERLQNGFTLFIREGSGARNLEPLLGGLLNAHMPLTRCCFCTDDKHIEDILQEGTIDWCLRKAVSLGCPPVEAVKMATLNPAVHYHLKNKGAIAPGYEADLVVVDDLKDFRIHAVYRTGQPVTEPVAGPAVTGQLEDTVHLPAFTARDLEQALRKDQVIGLVDHELYTLNLPASSLTADDLASCSYVCAMERYGKTGEYACGLLKGFNLKGGALAASYGHDSHNIIAAGDSFEDLALAIHKLEEIHGGYVLVREGRIAATLPLEIGGVMSREDAQTVADAALRMKKLARDMGVPEGVDPFATLSFLSLPVIPEIRITPQGMYDVKKRRFLDRD